MGAEFRYREKSEEKALQLLGKVGLAGKARARAFLDQVL
jgi:hypothetical protein